MIHTRVPFDLVSSALTRILGMSPKGDLTPDTIHAAQQAAPVPVQTRDFGSLPDFYDLSDAVIITASGLDRVGLSGDLFIITDVSYETRPRSAFAVNSADLEAFIAAYPELHGVAFFDGDVIVVEQTGAHIWIFDHDGNYYTLRA